MNQPDIVIKEVGKGGAVTVLSKDYYRKMLCEHLTDKKTYQKLDKNVDPTIKNKIKKLLSKNVFIDQHFKYLNEGDYNTSIFLGFPKIHKFHLKLMLYRVWFNDLWLGF